ncbi:hypothetical protein UFOVP1454_23 [uncultured Caudovirales phage]|uniref:Uncharacterized protein n=1 Tax=uncultured Caudovirales phage TaxID=2100421 RepID=A0A6J5SIE5_9CAUD|nr:hypothetical protein UFOVP1454_23 [uncultured Caudovirales phage]
MHPLIKDFFEKQEKLSSLPKFCKKYNLCLSTLKSWKRTNSKLASVESFDRVLNTLGYELAVVIKKDAFEYRPLS